MQRKRRRRGRVPVPQHCDPSSSSLAESWARAPPRGAPPARVCVDPRGGPLACGAAHHLRRALQHHRMGHGTRWRCADPSHGTACGFRRQCHRHGRGLGPGDHYNGRRPRLRAPRPPQIPFPAVPAFLNESFVAMPHPFQLCWTSLSLHVVNRCIHTCANIWWSVGGGGEHLPRLWRGWWWVWNHPQMGGKTTTNPLFWLLFTPGVVLSPLLPPLGEGVAILLRGVVWPISLEDRLPDVYMLGCM